MTVKTFVNALVFIFAIFGLASMARVVFRSAPDMLGSQIFLMLPIIISALLLMRLARRASKAA